MADGELHKLTANVAIGRNAAGVHWRSDAVKGLLLADLALTYHKAFEGFSLTHFDGRLVVVGAQNSLDRGSLKLVACNSLLPYDPILLDIFSAFIICFPLCSLAL